MSLAVSDLFPRCGGCNKLLAQKVTRPWSIKCGRCKTENYAPSHGEAKNLVVEPVQATPNHGIVITSVLSEP